MQKLKLYLVLSILFFTARNTAQAQVLSAGDIVFTGYNSSGTNVDSFSFVLLVNIPAGTQINFTDNAWLSTNQFRVGEQHMTWTAGQAFVAGREITIFGTTSPAPLTPNSLIATTNTSAGTCSGSMLNLSTGGDQIIAYQGPVASPTIIAGIHMNVYAVTGVNDCGNTTTATWDPVCVDGAVGTVGNPNWSGKPPTLTTGTNALWIGTFDVSASEEDWGVFNCTGPLATPAQVRAAVNNPANWTTGDVLATRKTSPCGCVFLGIIPLPVSIEKFTGKLNSDKTVSLEWTVSDQADVVDYAIERSNGNGTYTAIGTVAPGSASTYSLLDSRPQTGLNQYRLRIREVAGNVEYSKVVTVMLKQGSSVSYYPNPVKDKLTVQKIGAPSAGILSLTNADGRVLLSVEMKGMQQVINMEKYPAGIYFLKYGDGEVQKIVKE